MTLARSFVVVAWLHLRARVLAFMLPCRGQMGIFAVLGEVAAAAPGCKKGWGCFPFSRKRALARLQSTRDRSAEAEAAGKAGPWVKWGPEGCFMRATLPLQHSERERSEERAGV